MQLFGKSGATLIPFLNQGKAGIKELGEEAERLHVTMTTEGVEGAGEGQPAATPLPSVARLSGTLR
jgi:hypothetical protein